MRASDATGPLPEERPVAAIEEEIRRLTSRIAHVAIEFAGVESLHQVDCQILVDEANLRRALRMLANRYGVLQDELQRAKGAEQ